MMGKAQAVLGTITTHAAEGLLAALPFTVAQASDWFTFASAEKQIMEYARLKSMDLVVAMSDASRHSLKTVLLDHMHKQFSGDETATPGKLQQSLFDNFSQMNRDWRRIALTEAGNASNNGFIASLPLGSKVKRFEQYRGSCGYCKSIDGVVMTIVSPDDPNKNGDNSVWVGKDNVGRSSSPYKKTDEGMVKRDKSQLWWIPAGTVHPHCRGRWIMQTAHEHAVSDEFTDWFNNMVKENT
jgi:hypothetical protein